MSAPRKRFEDHSERWQRQKRKQGVTPRRWNAWLKLSPKSRRQTSAVEYGKGRSVIDQVRADLERDAFANMRNQLGQHVREATIRLGIKHMTVPELRWTTKASAYAIVTRAASKTRLVPDLQYPSKTRNPWWYR